MPQTTQYLTDRFPKKSLVAFDNELRAGLHALDAEEQNHFEVLTGKRFQQRAPRTKDEGGNGGGTEPVALELTSLNPNTAVIGSTDFTLRLLGKGFIEGCTIVWNGGDEPTVFVSDTELTTVVKPSTAVVAIAVPVAVRNPDDTLSNDVPFTFTAPTEAREARRSGPGVRA